MTDSTINADVTMGGETGALLAGRYRVVKQLGQGGMGSVWLAEDVQLDNRPVAIKMLPSVLVSNKRAYQQLKAEALVSLKLTHPNIATVRAFEENNGNPFLVVDYIDGVTLDDYLADHDSGAVGAERRPYQDEDGRAVAPRPPHPGGLPESEVLRLLAPIAAALDYAHSRGVIHRDVKPGNVMIAKDGTPYILDFGIAREIQETMTRVTGKLSSGTLMYMSPEQLHGAAPTPAQDVYSFAAMAYECLTGHPPFSRGQIEYQIEHDNPTPLDPQFANCGSGVMAGLAKRPEERPASCSALLVRTRNKSVPLPERPTRDLRVGKLVWRWFLPILFAGLTAVVVILYGGSVRNSDRVYLDRVTHDLCKEEVVDSRISPREEMIQKCQSPGCRSAEGIHELNTRDALCGKWSGTTVCGNKQSPVSTRRYNYDFHEDGTYVCEWTNIPIATNVTSTVIERGSWLLVGNKLKLTFAESKTRHSAIGTFDNKLPQPRTLSVDWRAHGTIELRRVLEEFKHEMEMNGCSEVEANYDGKGVFHYGARMSNGRTFLSTETAMVLERMKE